MENVLPLGTFWQVLSAEIGLSRFKISDVALKKICLQEICELVQPVPTKTLKVRLGSDGR